jgi:hypothetical protein
VATLQQLASQFIEACQNRSAIALLIARSGVQKVVLVFRSGSLVMFLVVSPLLLAQPSIAVTTCEVDERNKLVISEAVAAAEKTSCILTCFLLNQSGEVKSVSCQVDVEQGVVPQCEEKMEADGNIIGSSASCVADSKKINDATVNKK